jgi:fibronectin-binding autotransporter adhesin
MAIGHFIAEGGGVLSDGTFVISNSTVSGNAAFQGGGIYGVATLQNSIVANNGRTGNCYGSVSSIFSLSSDSSCHLTGPGDLNNTDPKLGTLGNYGGPTQTIPLLSGSPAIDAGNRSGCTDAQGHWLKTDQRGLPRPDKEDKGGCDMGAYESQSDQP